MVSLEIS